MTELIVIGIVLLLLVLIGLIRVSVSLSYDKEFNMSVSVLGIRLGAKGKNEKHSNDSAEKKQSEKKDNPINKLYKSRGLKGTIDLFFELLKAVVSKLKRLVKRIKIRNFKISLPVSGSDAADTAIKYGAICSAVYPAVAFADKNLNFKYKKIDVYADFDGNVPDFSISADIKAEIFFLVIFAVACLIEFYKFYRKIKPDIKDEEVEA